MGIEWQETLVIAPDLPPGSKLHEAEVDGGVLKAGFVNTPKVKGPQILEIMFQHNEHDGCRWPTMEEVHSAMKLYFENGSLLSIGLMVGFHNDFKPEDAVEGEPFSRTLQFMCIGQVNPTILGAN